MAAAVLCLRLRDNAVLRLTRLADIHADSDANPVLTSRRSSATRVLTDRIATTVLIPPGSTSTAAILIHLIRLSARIDVRHLVVVIVKVIRIPSGILTRTLPDDGGACVLGTVRRTAVRIPLAATVNRLSLRLIGQIRLGGWRLSVLIHHHHRRRWYRCVEIHDGRWTRWY